MHCIIDSDESAWCWGAWLRPWLLAIVAVYAAGAGSTPAADMYFSYRLCQQHRHAILLTHPSRWSAAALAGCTTVVATRATVQPLGLQGICMCMLNGCHAGCRAMLHHFNVVALHAVLQCRSLGLHGLACSTGSMPEAVGPLRCT